MKQNGNIATYWILASLCLLGFAEQSPAQTDIQQALSRLETEQDANAFETQISTPGTESLAVKVARAHAEAFLAILRDKSKELPLAQARLVEGDLFLS